MDEHLQLAGNPLGISHAFVDMKKPRIGQREGTLYMTDPGLLNHSHLDEVLPTLGSILGNLRCRSWEVPGTFLATSH